MSAKTQAILLGAALVAGTTAAVAEDLEKPEAQPISGKVDWVFDYEEGKRLSRASGKPMFVVFRCER